MTGCSCGCGGSGGCAGVAVVTPRPTVNRPGLPALRYRPGDYGDFLETMIARLASRPEFVGYTIRERDDPGIALLDCWSLVAGIVAFYAERAAGEGYLGTAAQPDSLGYLARLVSYQPRPALGASGYLAFTMDPGSTGTVPAGTAARSIAAQGQPQQTFETTEAITARSDWNQLTPRMTRPGRISPDAIGIVEQLTFAGASLGLQPGTRLMFDFGSAGAATRVAMVATPDLAAGTTLVRLVSTALSAIDGAWNTLSAAITTATTSAPTDPFAQAVAAILGKIGDSMPAHDELAIFIWQVEAALAIGVGRVPPGVADWLTGPDLGLVSGVLDAATALLPLLGAAERKPSPEVEYLQDVAALLATPPDHERGTVSRAVLDQAVPLVATAAIMVALRRPPSAPPSTRVTLPQSPARALAPASTAISALLAAADPRLAGVLPAAVSQQAVTAPPPVGTVIALRSKAATSPPALTLEIGPMTLADAGRPAAAAAPGGGEQGGAAHAPGGPVPAASAPPPPNILVIDGTPDSLVVGSWLVCEQVIDGQASPRSVASRITKVAQGTRQATVGVAPNTTSVTIPTSIVTLNDDAYDPGQSTTGTLTAYFGGVPLRLADEPVTDDISGDQVPLAQAYEGLYPGQRLIITGARTDIPGTAGIVASELTMVGGVEQAVDTTLPGDTTLPVLSLAVPLAYTYKRDTVTISGNVAAATQGETRTEVLGSGVAGQAGQAFPLRQVSAAHPLTWLPSDNALGAADTLTVRVNGVAWQESDDLTEAGPRDQAYRAAAGSDGGVTVTFGDGVRGSRLPSGQQNVTAAYRVGAGSAGNVAAGRITQLASRPLGVNAVTNPLPMSGGTDGDGPAAVRANAALRCLALDRLLSVRDYADFTAARAGIGKAAAAKVTDGDREVVHVTIAGPGDAPLDESDLLVTSLREALAELGDPFLPVRVAIRELLLLVLSAGVKIDPAYSWDLVEPAVRAAALAAAGFEASELGQPVYLSAIVAAMQAVPGVSYVDVDLFTTIAATASPVDLAQALLALSGQQAVAPVIDARPARFEPDSYVIGSDKRFSQDVLATVALRYGVTVAQLAALNPWLARVTTPDGGPPEIAGAGAPSDPTLPDGAELVIASGIRPAQLVMLSPDVPQTLILRSLP